MLAVVIYLHAFSTDFGEWIECGVLDIEAIWNYDDPDGSERRFRAALEDASDPDERAEIETQIARTMSLRRRFDDAHTLLDALEPRLDGLGLRPRVRYLLERGRTFNSSQNASQARALFEEAYALGLAAHEEFLAADAAHMIAIASSGDEAISWNLRTIELAKSAADPRAKKWIASAGNNLGWSYHDLGRYEEALEQFQAALEARQGGPIENILIARWCVARAYRSLGRLDEALALQLELAEEREKLEKPGEYVFEEIAECLYALGRTEESRPYFARAHEMLSKDPWLVADEPARLERLSDLATWH